MKYSIRSVGRFDSSRWSMDITPDEADRLISGRHACAGFTPGELLSYKDWHFIDKLLRTWRTPYRSPLEDYDA